MYYADEVIEQVRQANDIVAVIGNYVRLTKKGSKLFGLCPFHNEKTPSFSVSPDTQLYYCFGCGAGGNIFTFVMEYENYSFQEAVEYLANRVGIELPKEEEGKERKEDGVRKQLLEMNKLAARYYYYCLQNPSGKKAQEYFINRALTNETVKSFGLGYSTVKSDDLYHYLKSKGYSDEILSRSGLVKIEERGARDLFWNRVMFPIMDVNNRVIAFGGRVMGKGEPKYLNSPETLLFDKSRNLYGLNLARRSRKPYFLICEGYMDVISMHQAGFTNAVASLGTAFTSQQAVLLKRYTNQVVLTYDSDNAGIKAALRAIPILRQAGIEIKVLNMRPYKDPDEFIKAKGAESFEERINQAANSFLFEIEVLRSQYDFSDPAQETQFQRKVGEKLLIFSEELERENYLLAVADKFHINAKALRNLVQKLGSQLTPEEIAKRKEIEPKKIYESKVTPAKAGNRKAQRLLLSYLVLIPGCFRAVYSYLAPQDFLDDKYREVAAIIYEQMGQGNEIKPAELLNHFINDEQDYQQISEIFHTTIGKIEGKEEQEKVITELVRKVKQESLEQAGRNVFELAKLQEILNEQANLKKLNISL